MEEYRNAVYQISPGIAIYPFPGANYKTFIGEKSDIIYIIQILLSAIAVVYDDFETIVPSGTFDQKTSDAVGRFQKFNQLPITGIVDKRTWDALANNYNTFSDNASFFPFGERKKGQGALSHETIFILSQVFNKRKQITPIF